MMIDIASVLSYAEFNEVKYYKIAHEIWTKLKDIYGGDDSVRRDKAERLRGHLDQMKMREDKNIEKYVERIKATITTIRAFGGEIKEEIFVRYSELFFPSTQLECLLFKKRDVIQITR